MGKRFFALVLTAALALSVCGCGDSGRGNAGNGESVSEDGRYGGTGGSGAGSGSGGFGGVTGGGAENKNSSAEEQSPSDYAAEYGEGITSGGSNGDGSTVSVVNGWDGTWIGDGVTVKIYGLDRGEGTGTVHVDEAYVHTSLDEYSVDGDTLTGVYRITIGMADDLTQEQVWSFVMVKDGGTMSYSSSNDILFWEDLNQFTLEKGVILTKVIETEG